MKRYLMISLIVLFALGFAACGDEEGDNTGVSTGGIVTTQAIGITLPVPGELPSAAVVATNQFTGTVAWSAGEEAHTSAFAAATVYTATIALQARTGWTFDGVAANFFTIAGAPEATTVTNPAGGGNTITVEAVFPQTSGNRVITDSAILGLTPPVTGAEPVRTLATQNVQYSAEITWSPAIA